MKHEEFNIGDCIYYHGDRANREGWFVVEGLAHDRLELAEVDGDRLFVIRPVEVADDAEKVSRFVLGRVRDTHIKAQLAELEKAAQKYAGGAQ